MKKNSNLMVQLSAMYIPIIFYILILISIFSSLNFCFPTNVLNSNNHNEISNESTINIEDTYSNDKFMNRGKEIIENIGNTNERKLNIKDKNKINSKKCLGAYHLTSNADTELYFNKLIECFECFELNNLGENTMCLNIK